MSDTNIVIEFPFLNDGDDAHDDIVSAANAVGATIVSVDESDYTISFPSERAARSFVRTAFPDHDPINIDAIIAARNSFNY